jgi:hypothetical protein
VKGRREPTLLGWISREDGEMTPCWTAAYVVRGAASAAFATIFAFGEQPPEPLLDECRTNASGRDARFRWRGGALLNTVLLSRPREGEVSLDHRVAVDG